MKAHRLCVSLNSRLESNKVVEVLPLGLLPREQNLFRGGLVFKAHRILYHSTLGLRVIKKKNEVLPLGLLAREQILPVLNLRTTTSQKCESGS